MLCLSADWLYGSMESGILIYCVGGYRSFARYSHDPTPFESIWAFTPDRQLERSSWPYGD